MAIVVMVALTIIEKQRQHIGKQKEPMCGAVSGLPLQMVVFPNNLLFILQFYLRKYFRQTQMIKITAITNKIPIFNPPVLKR